MRRQVQVTEYVGPELQRCDKLLYQRKQQCVGSFSGESAGSLLCQDQPRIRDGSGQRNAAAYHGLLSARVVARSHRDVLGIRRGLTYSTPNEGPILTTA